ncbi:dTDP-4-dehydrorhamnose reductase [Prevotella brunnea]|uniref:dTDP-4-dehydrorhamnose reductase n=1 Tax=Prevotella brunnea TaxID=2508867 RepID=A0A5C8GMF8_9BACT|nr:dTDP-4-dehydrorhamnose reductase [Prevotella brunnea]MDR0186171.1 dTDP-4-dehydrorhamnose reductase [Prevotella brunnea]TXJ63293.1 dTDP-4-dehydrorhamnose reductase [Prevotella brunnea]
MNILVTGANGMLGKTMQEVSKDSNNNYLFTDICDGYNKVDITDLNDVRRTVKENNIKCIVNCAAWTNVDKAETAGEIVEKLNADGPANLALAMKEVNGLLVHISTDYVFGNDPYNTPCTEEQKGTPTGVYGLTKLHGEEKIRAIGGKYIILRTAWLYGEHGHNFVKTILNLIETKKQIKVVFDQCGTPTYARDLANAIFDIVEKGKYEGNTGIYHFSNEGVCSWYDFAKKIAELMGNTHCEILPCHSEEFPSPVKRPAYSVFDKTKIKKTFDTKIPYWTDSLTRCVENLKNKA